MMRVPDCAFQDGSYPCGYQDGGKLPDCNLCHRIKRAAIKQVVDWINSQMTNIEKDAGIVTIPLDGLEAKLKEWGIEES